MSSKLSQTNNSHQPDLPKVEVLIEPLVPWQMSRIKRMKDLRLTQKKSHLASVGF